METPKGVFTYTPVDADGKLTQPADFLQPSVMTLNA